MTIAQLKDYGLNEDQTKTLLENSQNDGINGCISSLFYYLKKSAMQQYKDMNGQDIEGFEKDQLELLHILTQAEEVNLRKVKVPISISKIIRLRLGDALQFVIYHNERHMQQALNIIEHKSFPKN